MESVSEQQREQIRKMGDEKLMIDLLMQGWNA